MTSFNRVRWVEHRKSRAAARTGYRGRAPERRKGVHGTDLIVWLRAGAFHDNKMSLPPPYRAILYPGPCPGLPWSAVAIPVLVINRPVCPGNAKLLSSSAHCPA